MPELPEVETIKLGLQKYLVGHKIMDVEVKVSKLFQGAEKNIIGSKVVGISRIGKGLIIEFDNGYSMAIHLKLTGQVIYSGKEVGKVALSKKTGGNLPSVYTHVIFALDRDSFLYYNDPRKFGWIKIIKRDQIKELPFFKEMGPEPPVAKAMEGRALLDPVKFSQIIKSSNSPIKILLMDQKKIGGIGNIYSNEALFLARIDPRRKTKDLSDKEINKLYGSLMEVLKRGLKYGGSSEVNFVNAFGEDGAYQNHFLVYARKGKRCQKCNRVVEKIELGGRGTYFCPSCQK